MPFINFLWNTIPTTPRTINKAIAAAKPASQFTSPNNAIGTNINGIPINHCTAPVPW